jgi:drug/metabolite transporter (DMT)-like permease
MRPRDIVELLTLSAIWGASFLFIRIAVPEFGSMALALVRVFGAALMLLPLIAWRGELRALRTHAAPIAVVGIVGSAVPFVMYGAAALAVTAGVSAILNAATPLWGALMAWLMLGDRLTVKRLLGLGLGAVGVLALAWDQADLKPGAHGVSGAMAVAACLLATVCYGFVAAFARKRLVGVPPMAVAAGSQAAATLAIMLALVAQSAVQAVVPWPAALAAPSVASASPGAAAWASAVTLAVLCTGVAYVLYFRLVAHVGATNATTVTLLIPLFAVLWGYLFLGESVTLPMIGACGLILLGTGLATGILGERNASRAPPHAHAVPGAHAVPATHAVPAAHASPRGDSPSR